MGLRGFAHVPDLIFPNFFVPELQKNPVEGFSAGLEDDNIFKWEVMIVGPTDTL